MEGVLGVEEGEGEMVRVMRTFAFDAAHRLVNHEGKCKWLHGHRYSVNVHLEPEKGLDELGRVLDFSEIKERVGGWLDRMWDHNTILRMDDPLYHVVSDYCKPGGPYTMLENPTAENLAITLVSDIIPTLLSGLPVRVVKVEVFETPNCMAVVEGDDGGL